MVLGHQQFPDGVKIFKQSLRNVLIGWYTKRPTQQSHTLPGLSNKPTYDQNLSKSVLAPAHTDDRKESTIAQSSRQSR